jgi:hypothetical protein
MAAAKKLFSKLDRRQIFHPFFRHPKNVLICFLVAFSGSLVLVSYGVLLRFNRTMPSSSSPAAASRKSNATAAPCFIEIVVMSDRNNSELPLKGLVNSILQHTTRPVTLHIVTTAHTIPWLQQLHSQYFQIYLYDPIEHGLYNRSQHLINQTSFRPFHYSANFAISKIYLPLLPYRKTQQQHQNAPKILMLDDDIVFYKDLAPLWDDILYQNPDRMSLYCPVEPRFVQMYFTGRDAPHNGDTERYCNSGMMGFPIRNEQRIQHRIVQMLEDATVHMMREYPRIFYTLADQDIVNRAFVENKHDIDLIPWEWGCNNGTCKDPSLAGHSSLCPNFETQQQKQNNHHNHHPQQHLPATVQQNQTCYSFHFLAHHYQHHLVFQNPQLEYDTTFRLDPVKLLHTVFHPRIEKGIANVINCP